VRGDMSKTKKDHTVFSDGIRYKIIQKTIEIIERDGGVKISVHDLAKECGLVTTTLYTYFSSKNDIINEARNEMARKFDSVASLPVPKNIPEEMKIRMIAVFILDFAIKNRWVVEYIDPFANFEATKKLINRLSTLLKRFSNDENQNEYRVYRFLAGIRFKIKYRFFKNEEPTESDIEDLCRFMSYPES
jgi:AcrR family transcriptional regulator